MSKRIFGVFFMGLGCVLVLASGLLLVFNILDSNRAANELNGILSDIKVEAVSFGDETANDTLSEALVSDADGFIGYLSIPALGLQLPVKDTWSYEALRSTPCRYFGDISTDDLVICGHNYSCHFGRLRDLQIGDEVSFTDITGNTICYTVEFVTILKPDDTAKVIDGSYDLTLYTCTYGGKYRVTVRCNREA